ncbi:DUF4391 domain-containing protein [Acetobacterium bakii]|uniref:Methyl-accepting chemotaxis protein n=1 Tax=Acetobacterium bakii TaxID=52689 RepID=A0A0L6U1R3_9FIRM|nr:DUF4391 domain-containing protein [Acetobacterium bakii]KNZ42446.1 hypothetical protein AKG39_06700 [Acetobacterium bakii]
MEKYTYFNLPKSCEVNNSIFKKQFSENTDLSTADKKLFTEGIKKITWLYCLKPDTLNLQPYKDDIREYEEIEIIEVDLKEDKKLSRIAEIIMRTIPYPMVLVFRLDHQTAFWTAHQQINQKDISKNTLEPFVNTGFLKHDSEFFKSFDLLKMRFTNYYDLYTDLVDAISIFNANQVLNKTNQTTNQMTGEIARDFLGKLNTLEQNLIALRTALKKEKQFNRKMELSIKIKNMEASKNKLLKGEQ